MSSLLSLVELAAKVGEMDQSVEEEKHEALEGAAKIVEREAKSEIGHYQPGAGSFPPWAGLADATKDDRVRLGFTENNPGLRTGNMRESISHEVGDDEAFVGSNADEMVYFEISTVHQPPRSVLGMVAERKATEAAEILGQSVVTQLVGKGVVNGGTSIP